MFEFYRTYYGPTSKTPAALDAEKQPALRQDLEQIWMEHNIATDGSTSHEAAHLEVVAIRQ